MQELFSSETDREGGGAGVFSPARRASLALKREAYVRTRLAELRAEYARVVSSYNAAIAELERVLQVGE